MVKVFADATDILDSIIEQVDEKLTVKSWDKSENPHESNVSIRHNIEHWIAYTGSSYNDAVISTNEFGDEKIEQVRTLEFGSYVRVNSLKNDHKPALILHQAIMNFLNGYVPKVTLAGVRTPLTLKSDALLAPRGTETTFRYQALYRIETVSISIPENGVPFNVSEITTNIYKSDLDKVGSIPDSILDDIFVIEGN